jgi:uncharacterized protein (TIGR01777 family)
VKIILTGGTGFIGASLIRHLAASHHQIVSLSRNPQLNIHTPQLDKVEWDGKSPGPWADNVDGADAVINLAGETIGGKRWTSSQKARILGSRVDATKALVNAIRKARVKPGVFVSASAVGYYGDVADGDVTESHPRGNDFLAGVCDQWEREAYAAETHGVRVITPRFGVVLDRGGGALDKLLLPFKMYVGGPLGSGRQWFPWVHREDVAGVIQYALDNSSVMGPLNVAAPESVTNEEFCRALGKAMRRPCWARVPAFVLRAALGEMADMLLTGQKVVPEKLLKNGYRFRYPHLDDAFADILNR